MQGDPVTLRWVTDGTAVSRISCISDSVHIAAHVERLARSDILPSHELGSEGEHMCAVQYMRERLARSDILPSHELASEGELCLECVEIVLRLREVAQR